MAVCPCIKPENKKNFQGHKKIFQFETRHQYRGTNICIWQKSSSLASACIVNAWSLALDSLLTWNGLCLFCLLTFWTRPPWPAERGKIKYRPPPLGDGYIERLPLTADPINHPPSETLWSPQPPLPSSTTTLQLLCKTTEQSLQRFDRKIQGLSSKVRLSMLNLFGN